MHYSFGKVFCLSYSQLFSIVGSVINHDIAQQQQESSECVNEAINCAINRNLKDLEREDKQFSLQQLIDIEMARLM